MWIKCFTSDDLVSAINPDNVDYFIFNTDEDNDFFTAYINNVKFFIPKDAFTSSTNDYFADFLEFLDKK